MSSPSYLWLHLAGVSLALLAIGGLAQPREGDRRRLVIAHAVGLVAVLIGGFGLLVRLGISWPLPGWVWTKLALWLILGGSAALFRRRPDLSTPLWWAVWVVFLVAAYLGIHKGL